jgi:hypothetical protein
MPEVAAGTAVAAVSGVLLFMFVFWAVGAGLWIWSVVDVIKRSFTGQNDKMIWVLVILLLPILGSIIYLIAGRKKGTMPGVIVQPESITPPVNPNPPISTPPVI